ncbi:MAG: beta-ketoacyl-ACP synthase III [Kiritimatiellia bacterium]
MALKILGTGSYLPSRVVTNDDLSKTLDTSDEWIFSHTGIHSRHLAADDECTSSMATKAAQAALKAAGADPGEIGLIVMATSTPDYNTFPATACLVQAALGCTSCGAYDVQAACAGFVYALEQARCWVKEHRDRKAIVVAAETLSRIVDWRDRASCILFGDGAGAVVIGYDETPDGPSSHSVLWADGKGALFITREGGTRRPHVPGMVQIPYLELQGHDVFAFAVRSLATVTNQLCEKLGTTPEKLDRVFAHQANGRIIEAVARRMRLAPEKFYLNLAHTGNTSAASIPLALDEAMQKGELKDGMKLVLCGFGAGLVCGGIYLTWPYL